MIIIYTIIFVIIGLFIWLYITAKNKREDEKINKDIDFYNDNDDPEDDSLSNYDEYVHRSLGVSKKNDDYITDSIDDFINNFTYRDSEFEDVIEQSMNNEEENSAKEEIEQEAKNIPNDFDYTISISPIKVTNNISEVLNSAITGKVDNKSIFNKIIKIFGKEIVSTLKNIISILTIILIIHLSEKPQ